ncbi:MAG: hypothetical protein SFV54_03385 [Bryobacteraceae bacterium]|nr:hypothetical protein [Bryobacteraceae bacterium]
MRMSPRLATTILAVWGLSLAGCGEESTTAAAAGEAYVGPIQLELREELTPKSPVSAVAKHGERVSLVQRRRRFARVRTEDGREGWVDSRNLMRPEQMAELRGLWDRAAKLPSMGAATVWDQLNVHTAPNRYAPTFARIPEKGKVDVIWATLAPRVPYEDPGIDPAPRPSPVSKRVKKKKEPKVPPPPMPAAPSLPSDWQDLSRTVLPEGMEPTPKPAPSPVAMDEWSLVRLADGKAGWALSRPLQLAVPDEVAQYAEGKRITSYFSLGAVNDEGVEKHHYLWTTMGSRNEKHHFDSFRVFIYNARRNRYETSYIERGVKGYFPVLVKNGATPTFSLLLEDAQGQVTRRTYQFQGYRVQMIDKVADRVPDPVPSGTQLASSVLPDEAADVPSPPRGFFEKIGDRAAAWKKRILGR